MSKTNEEIIKNQESGKGIEDYFAPHSCIGCDSPEAEYCENTLCRNCWSNENNSPEPIYE